MLTKKHVFVQVQGNVFIQGNYIYWTLLHSRNSRNIYSKIVPQPLYDNYKLYNYYLLNKV